MSAAHMSTKRHMNLMSVIVFVSCLLLVAGNTVFAVPYLQLDARMSDGSPVRYPSAPEESIVTTGPVFTLYALVNSTNSAFVEGGTYWISVAIIPDLGETPVPDLGSYDFDGDTFNVTAGREDYEEMTYGVPPVGTYSKDKNLPGHGVFDTYYREHEFTLDPTGQANLYNSQDNFGGPLQEQFFNPDGALYYQAFLVDATKLKAGSFLHFDFYTKVFDDDGSSIVDFAPFSHDVTHTPVPGAVLLGLLGLGVAGVKLRKFA